MEVKAGTAQWVALQRALRETRRQERLAAAQAAGIACDRETGEPQACVPSNRVQYTGSRQGTLRGDSAVLRMLRRVRTTDAAHAQRQAVLQAARVREQARRRQAVQAEQERQRTVVAVPLSALRSTLTLEEKCTILEQRDGTPWRRDLHRQSQTWQRAQRRGLVKAAGTIRRRGIGMVSGTETRASERWQASQRRDVRKLRWANGTPFVSRCFTITLSPLVRESWAAGEFSTDTATRTEWQHGNPWRYFSPRASEQPALRQRKQAAAAGETYEQRLAKYGADIAAAQD